jgi:hypothetical protein
MNDFISTFVPPANRNRLVWRKNGTSTVEMNEFSWALLRMGLKQRPMVISKIGFRLVQISGSL